MIEDTRKGMGLWVLAGLLVLAVLAGGLLVVLYFYIGQKDLPRTRAQREAPGLQFLEER